MEIVVSKRVGTGNPEYEVLMVRTLNLDVEELDVEKLSVTVVTNMLIYC